MNAILSHLVRRLRQQLSNKPTAATWIVAGALLLIALVAVDRTAVGISNAAEVRQLGIVRLLPRQTATLRDRLIVGLQARLDSEIAFVELVVLRVQTGQLPQRLVDQTFFWARQRAALNRWGRARRPIIFFQPAMRARADRIGVAL